MNAASAAGKGGAGVEVEARWLIVWPNGEVYGSHDEEVMANHGLKALVTALASYSVPAAYFPTVKRRKRTITRTQWEDA